ncbi:zinc metallopeptidase [Desulfurispira natronophila]|uniref:Zinc metallopeptidase n=1 Tax=Desulfurispira natronophila TaxID=682562 RepID=A0A7W8DGW3_9BACT|nr:zinc metallopeptidase [Desulfurispira natronophila]MBB5021663.1 hypothetical protein [Desulfurispira natronophila]
MHVIIGIVAILLALYLPQWWATSILRRHQQVRPDLPGTGGELARHLLDSHQLQAVPLEYTQGGDHYDPTSRTVRLRPEIMQGQSLTAVAVASHEVGHALQHAAGSTLLNLRTSLARIAIISSRLGGFAIMATPAMMVANPGLGRLILLLAVCGIALSIVVHLVTLPVELDASFGKALPLLRQGGYVAGSDYATVRSILTACSLTYLAASLGSILSFWRWFRFPLR